MVDVIGVPSLGSDLPASASYAELHDAFLRSTRSDVAELLQRLVAQLRHGRYPAGRPYRHVNDFTKIVIWEQPAARLTLHYWPAAPGMPDDVSRPHDHRFAFSSILLGGSQHFVELEESDDSQAEQWRRFEYRPYLRGRIAAVTAGNNVGLQPFRTVNRAPLEGHYRISPHVLHQAVTRRVEACVTLVLRGPRERRTSRVYYRPTEPPPRGRLQFGRRIDHDEVIRQVDHACSLVTAR